MAKYNLNAGFNEEAGISKYMYPTIPDFYDRVRQALGVSDSTFSDDYIDFPENAPLSELRIKAKVPNWADLNEDKRGLFQSCIIYSTCYSLFPIARSRIATEQSTPTLTIKFDTSTSEDLGKYFLDLIDALIDEINGVESTYFFGFNITKKYPVVSACGGWCN